MRFALSSFFAAAAADPGSLPRTLDPDTQNSLRGIVPVLLAIFVVVSLVVVWAVFIRRSPKYRRRGALLDGDAALAPERRRRRRRRRGHRSRNPTRAEAGGLPPPGTGGSDPPPL